MTTRRIIHISYFTVLTIIGAMLRIPAGAVSFSMQTFFVILSGLVIGRRDGAAAQLVYMIMGLIGLPVFTTGGGIHYVFQPSFGYIIGFVLGAWTAGFVMSRFKVIKSRHIFLAGVIGLAAIYIPGMSYQVMILVLVNGLTVPAAFFTLVNILYMAAGDIALVFLISIFYPRVMKMIGEGKNETKSGGQPL